MKKKSKILIVILSTVLFQNAFNIFPVRANELSASAIERAENISLDEKCIARYNSIRISWHGEKDHVYKIEAGDSLDGPFTLIAENLNSSEYIHENVGIGQKKYYHIIDQTTGNMTAVFSNDKYTGFRTIVDQAKLTWSDDLKQRHIFDGTNIIDLDDQISKINTLTGGTVIVKGSFDSTDGWKQNASMLGINNSGIFGVRHPNNNNQSIESFGIDLSGGLRATYANTNFLNTTHMAVYSNPASNNSGKIIASFDGNTTVSFDNNDALKGFFTRFSEIKTLSIGGNRDENGNITNPWYGTIDYIIVTDEVLSQNEINAISSDAPAMNIEASDTLTASIVSKYSSNILTWNAVKGADAYTILVRDDPADDFNFLTITGGLKYVDNSLTTNNREYKIVAGSQESEILTAKNGLQSGIIYKTFNDNEGILDGNSCIDILNGNQELLNKIKTMSEGSIVMKFRFNDSNTPKVLFSAKNKILETPNYASNGSNSGKDLITLYLKENNELRSDLNQTRATAMGHALSDENWHTLVFSNSKDSVNGKQLRVTIDGKEILEFHGNSANVGLFDKTPTINQMTLGGILENDGSVLYGLDGEISYFAILDEVISDQEAINLTSETKNKIDDLFDEGAFNTWVFTGGSLAQGSLQDIGGVRNYTGLFEEVIRWNLATASMQKRQRFVINTAKRNQNIKDIDTNYDSLIKAYQPKALALMLDNNDTLSDSEIEEHLLSIIDKNNNNDIYSVVQIPPVQDDSSIRLNDIVNSALSKVDSLLLKNILVINHDELFKKDNEILSDKFNSDGSLNAKGHLAIANQLSLKTVNRTTTITENNISKNIKQIPTFISDVPTVLVSNNQLNIEVPDNANVYNYSYKLDIDGITISGNFIGNKAEIKNLPANKNFNLIVQGNNGMIQLKTLIGTTNKDSEVSVKTDSSNLSDLQKEIYTKVQQSKKMKWLFLGDSITHGALHTNGYDSLPQLFEKYLRNELNREDDVVINTGVSSATLQELMNNKEARYERYKDADVVVLMFGTNDANYSDDTTSYRENLKAMISEIKENNSIPVLRTPNKLFSNDNRGNRLSKYVSVIREVAKEENCIIVDHYNQWEDASYINDSIGKANGDWMNTDYIHPNHLGQLKMTQKLITEIGLWNSESIICNLDYETNTIKEISEIAPKITLNDTNLVVDIEKLATEYNQSFGSVTIEATINGTVYSKTVYKDSLEPIKELILTNIPKGGTINILVKASLDTTNKEITFKNQEILNNLNKDLLIDKINQAKNFTKEEYTFESYNNLLLAIKNAEQLLETAQSQNELDEAVKFIDTAIKDLVKINVNKLGLSIAISMANNVTQEQLDKVVLAVVTEFSTALIEAQDILANDKATQEQVDTSFARLASAMHMLEFYKGDKTELETLITSTNELQEENYTADSWTALQEGIEAATEVMNDENAMQEDVDEAYSNLQAAINNLVEVKEVDKTILEAMVNKVLRLDGSKYTSETWNNLVPVFQEAQDVLANGSVTQEEVDNAYNALVKVYVDLRLIPDKSLLQELINKANGLNVTNYTIKSWNVMQSALNKAQAALVNENIDDAGVEIVYENLMAGIKGLEMVKSEDETVTVNTGDTTDLLNLFASLMLSLTVLYENKKRKHIN